MWLFSSLKIYKTLLKNELQLRYHDISIVVRSSKAFYRSSAMRTITSIATGRDIAKDDRYFRDTITVTANARNIGLQ